MELVGVDDYGCSYEGYWQKLAFLSDRVWDYEPVGAEEGEKCKRQREMKKYTLVHRWYHWRNEEWWDDQNNQPLAQNENDFLNTPAAFRRVPSFDALQSYSMYIDSSTNPFVVTESTSKHVDPYLDDVLVRRQSMVWPRITIHSVIQGIECATGVDHHHRHTWFSFIHNACRFFNFRRVYGKCCKRFPI